MPNQDDINNQTTPKITPVMEDVLPPMPASNKADLNNPSPASPTSGSEPADTPNGSAAPSDDIANPQIIGNVTPKKKFAGGKVIATILGLFLLVGGVGAGVFLTGQNQDIREKASSNVFRSPCTANECSADNYPVNWVNHYHCDDVKPLNTGCNDEYEIKVESASFQFNCGTEQIDHSDGTGFTSMYYDEDCTGGSGGVACLPVIFIYDSNFTKVNDPSKLAAGTAVRVGIIDRYKTAVFAKARFTINGTTKETTKKREVFISGTSGPKMTIFYDDFTTTAGTTKINAQVQYGGIWY